VRALSARLNAAIVGCPPSRLRTERIAADALAPADRRAWYWKANREAMNDAIDVVFRGQTVVTDRSFASTAAYGAAERGAVASLDDVPRDMPKPDAIFFLSLPEDERQRRLHGRGDARTPEENRLSHDEAFRQRVVEGYRALGTVSVDAQGPVEEIVEQIVREVAGQ
jgi:thymidylate kinase